MGLVSICPSSVSESGTHTLSLRWVPVATEDGSGYSEYSFVILLVTSIFSFFFYIYISDLKFTFSIKSDCMVTKIKSECINIK